MFYSIAELEEIRRWRKHLIWVFFVGAIASGVQLFTIIGEAFLAGVSEHQEPNVINPIGAMIYLCMAYIAYRLAKILDPGVRYYLVVTVLMFLPLVNFIVITSLLMDSSRVLAGPKLYK